MKFLSKVTGKRMLAGVTSLATVATTFLLATSTGPAQAAGTWDLKWSKTDLGTVMESSPTVATIQGQDAVIVGSRSSGRLHAQRFSDGGDLPGFAVDLGNGIDSSPAVVDSDFDGANEIFVGSGTAAQRAGHLWRISQSGGVDWKFSPRDNDFPSLSMFSSPAIADVTGDGIADVSGFSLGLLGWSLNAHGQTNSGWPFYQDDTIFSSPAIYDVNGDGVQDYIVGGDSAWGAPVDHQGGILRAISGNGQLLWEFKTDDIIRSSPAIGDVDGDGRPEIVVGAGYYYYDKTGHTNDAKSLFVLDTNGNLKWRRDLGGFTPGSPALADLNGDGRLDIVQTTWNGTSKPGIIDQTVFAYDGNGNTLPNWNQKHLRLGSALGQVATADFNNDGAQDVLVASGGGMAAYDGRSGNELFALNEGAAVAYQNTPWIGYIGGKLNIVAAGTKAGGAHGVMQRWEYNGASGALGWSQFRKDNQHSGSTLGARVGTNFCAGDPSDGYSLIAADGGVFSFCDPFYGSMGGQTLNKPVVSGAKNPVGTGYWMVASDGGIFAFGDAGFYGSMGGQPLNSPIVGMTPTPTGRGYWLVASDGGIFAFGDAGFYGSMGGQPLNKPIVGMASSPTGGYWMVASDGGIFAFGDAPFNGSMGGQPLNKPIVGMAASPTGGYWMVASDGGIFAFNAPFHGSMGGQPLNKPIVGISAEGGGYRFVASDGGIFSFGLGFYGSMGGRHLNQPVIGMF